MILIVLVSFQVGGWSMLGKRGVKASYSISTAWTPALHGQISVGNGKQVKTLEISAGYGKQDLNISAVLSTLDKVPENVFMLLRFIYVSKICTDPNLNLHKC